MLLETDLNRLYIPLTQQELNICDENENGSEFEECEFNKIDTEYMFLGDTLGWKEGIIEYKDMAQGMDAIITLAWYLFLTEQMNCKKRP